MNPLSFFKSNTQKLIDSIKDLLNSSGVPYVVVAGTVLAIAGSILIAREDVKICINKPVVFCTTNNGTTNNPPVPPNNVGKEPSKNKLQGKWNFVSARGDNNIFIFGKDINISVDENNQISVSGQYFFADKKESGKFKILQRVPISIRSLSGYQLPKKAVIVLDDKDWIGLMDLDFDPEAKEINTMTGTYFYIDINNKKVTRSITFSSSRDTGTGWGSYTWISNQLKSLYKSS